MIQRVCINEGCVKFVTQTPYCSSSCQIQYLAEYLAETKDLLSWYQERYESAEEQLEIMRSIK